MHVEWTFLEVLFFDRQAALWVWHLKRGAPQVAWHKETAGWPGLEVAWATTKNRQELWTNRKKSVWLQHIATKRKRRAVPHAASLDSATILSTKHPLGGDSNRTDQQQPHSRDIKSTNDSQKPNNCEQTWESSAYWLLNKSPGSKRGSSRQFTAVPYFTHRCLLAQDPDDRSLWKGSWHLFLARLFRFSQPQPFSIVFLLGYPLVSHHSNIKKHAERVNYSCHQTEWS